MSNKKPESRGYIASVVTFLVTASIALLLIVNRQYVVDQIRVWQYSPSEQISALVTESGISDSGKFYFYASHPSLEGAQSFNNVCERKEASAAILGCYNGLNIYIYNVTDERLQGVRGVTAAHEMLHAAYDRLSESEKSRIDTLLETEYTRLKADKNLAERMEFYARTEPGERGNELHSVIATEVANIGNELENYYKQYFSNRSRVVALHSSYQAVFDRLQERADILAGQLDALRIKINTSSRSYNDAVNMLNADIESFNARSKSGDFDSQSQFNTERARLLQRSEQLEVERQGINDNIAQYDALRSELATIASQSKALNQSIDSSLAPSPSL